MGKYVDNIGQTFEEKIEALILKHNASFTLLPKEFKEDLVCVMDNGIFAAAVYCDSKAEFARVSYDDGRRKQWMIVPNAAQLVS